MDCPRDLQTKLLLNPFVIKHPGTVLVAGPTIAGKTEFVIQLLRHRNHLIKPKPERILWGYGQKNERQMTKISTTIPQVEFFEGIPDLDDIDPEKNNLLILDDLMDEIGKNQECAHLFTRGSHHKNITVIAIIHNLFNQQRFMRTIALNSRYYILFKSPRDNQQIEYFGRQIFPRHKHFLSDALSKATEKPFGYLVIDLHPQTPDLLRVLTGIFPYEIPRLFCP